MWEQAQVIAKKECQRLTSPRVIVIWCDDKIFKYNSTVVTAGELLGLLEVVKARYIEDLKEKWHRGDGGIQENASGARVGNELG